MDENIKIYPTRHEIQARARDAKKHAVDYSDMVRNVIIMVVVAIIASIATGIITTAKLKKKYEKELVTERFRVEQEVAARMRSEYGVDEAEAEALAMQDEARTIAKVLYPMQYNSDLGLRSAAWCVLNRVDSQWYPGTVYDVCSQDSQWMGWSDDNPVVERLYNIALEAVTQWHSGIHAVSTEFLFLDWNTREITLRSKFETGRGCHYWYEEDWT